MSKPGHEHGKLRVYADTSVIGGCEDPEFRKSSRRLIERCARGEITLVISAVTLRELYLGLGPFVTLSGPLATIPR